MSVLKKTVKTLLLLIVALIVGLFVGQMFLMYKPVLDASEKIDNVSTYAMSVQDELVNRDVKIIGLGEATHGNREFQKLKLDVLKTLIRDNGVSAICFEMDYAEGVLINDYVTNQTDMTIEELFSHIAFDIYHTEEIKELIEWMREYNADSKDGYLECYGFDIQNPDVDIYVINEFVEEHQVLNEFEWNKSLKAFLANEFEFRDDRADEMLDALKIYREVLSDEMYQDCHNIDKVLKCIDNVFKADELVRVSEKDSVAYGTYRDQAMAENIMDIYHSVGYPIMITGHNGHVGYAGSYVKTAGSYLKEEFGDDYFVIGTDYFKTTVSITADNGRKNHTSYSADPLAYQAKALGTYYLRFDDLKDDETMNGIVTNKMPTGSLGEGFSFLNKLLPASVRVYAPVTDLYDAMVFVYDAIPFTVLGY